MRRSTFVLLHLYLVVQIAAPLAYYLGNQDPNDERFAWRMFSLERMVVCSPAFYVGDETRPIPLLSHFHEAWRTLASRGRRVVVERMADHLCAANPGEPVRVVVTCRTLDREIHTMGERGRDVCPNGQL